MNTSFFNEKINDILRFEEIFLKANSKSSYLKCRVR